MNDAGNFRGSIKIRNNDSLYIISLDKPLSKSEVTVHL